MRRFFPKKNYGVWQLLLLILMVAVYFFWSSREAQSKDAEEPSYHTALIQSQNVPIESTYVGYITPIHEVSIQPYVNGYLDKITVNGGDEVKAGQTMIVIEPSEYKAKLDAAKAATLQAQANYNNAQIYYERIQKAGSKAISKTEVDNAKASFLSAQATLAQAKANQALAQVNYNYTIIKAPIDGIVGNVNLTKGNYVSPSTPALLSVIQYNPIRVVFSITDKDYLDEVAKAPNLFGNEKIKLRLSNGKIFDKIGKFQFSDNALDRATNSLAIYADFENEDKTLLANAYVDVILERTFENGVLIPQGLVSMQALGNFVYTVNNNLLNQSKIEIVSNVGESYLVRNTFKAGDYLVLDKISRFAPNQKVKMISANSASPKVEKK